MSPAKSKTLAVAVALLLLLATPLEQPLANDCGLTINSDCNLLVVDQGSPHLTCSWTESDKQTYECLQSGDRKGYCRRVIWAWKLRDCEKFLRQSCGWRRGESCREHLEECCLELEELGRECVCDGIRHVVMRRLWDLQGKMRREMVQKARNLPAFCSMGIGRCYVPKHINI